MADTSNLTNYLKDVATAIKKKKGTTDPILAANFDIEIETIETNVIESIDGAKIFNSISEMKSDNTSVAGDMAVVYNTGVTPSSSDVYFRRLYCPKTVTISNIKSSVNKWSLVSDDGSIGTTSMNISPLSALIKFTTPEGTIMINYYRDSGTTNVYSRRALTGPGVSGDTVAFDRDVHFVRTNESDTTSEWSPAISYFLQIDNLNFEGLFEYVENQDTGSYVKVPLISGLHYGESFVWDKTYYDKPLDINTATQIVKKIKSEQGYNYEYASIFVNSNGNVCMAAILPSDEYIYADQRILDSLSFNLDGMYEGLGFRDSSSESIESVGKAQICVYKLDMDNMTYTVVSDKLSYSWQGTNNSYDRVTVYSVDAITAPYIVVVDTGAHHGLAGSMFKRNGTIFTFYNLPYNDESYRDTTYYYTGYVSADMPFTAISDDLLLGKTAYTNGGVIVGTAAPSIDTSDATAVAQDLIKDKTAYVNGEKIIGTRREVVNYGAKEATYIEDKNYVCFNINDDVAINNGGMVLRSR